MAEPAFKPEKSGRPDFEFSTTTPYCFKGEDKVGAGRYVKTVGCQLRTTVGFNTRKRHDQISLKTNMVSSLRFN